MTTEAKEAPKQSRRESLGDALLALGYAEQK